MKAVFRLSHLRRLHWHPIAQSILLRQGLANIKFLPRSMSDGLINLNDQRQMITDCEEVETEKSVKSVTIRLVHLLSLLMRRSAPCDTCKGQVFRKTERSMKIRPIRAVLAHTVLAVGLSILCTQCGIPTPAGFAALESKAETNPSPHAIVGMWHLRHVDLISKSTVSTLFERNGRVLVTLRTHVSMAGVESVREIPSQAARYGYDGNGWWSIQNSARSSRFRLADGKLLHYKELKSGRIHKNILVRIR